MVTWGTGPGSTYPGTNHCSPQARIFTNFQQNPGPYQPDPPLSAVEVENQETAADMFLNWVYRKQISNQGFLNRTWKPTDINPASSTPCNVTAGCLESNTSPPQPGTLLGHSGNSRFIWLDARMGLIFTAHNW